MTKTENKIKETEKIKSERQIFIVIIVLLILFSLVGIIMSLEIGRSQGQDILAKDIERAYSLTNCGYYFELHQGEVNLRLWRGC